MRSRRPLLLLALILLALGMANAMRRDQLRREQPPSTLSTTAPTPVGGAEANVVQATLPADRVVKVKLGDVVALRVTSDTPDVARILELGVTTPVGPQIEGTMRFEADARGRFPVTLTVAGRQAGVVEVH